MRISDWSSDVCSSDLSGPSTFARASTADPGDLLANPDALLTLVSSEYPQGLIPAYPYRASATSGFGAPTQESNPAPGLNARAEVTSTGSVAQATMPKAIAPAIASFGTLSSLATTDVDGSTVTVRARSEMSGFSLLDVLKIDSIVTDITVSSTGEETTVTGGTRSEEHTSELQSLMRHSYAVFCLKKKTKQPLTTQHR